MAWPGEARRRVVHLRRRRASRPCCGTPRTYADRMSVISHQAYGPLVGVPRLLDLLDRHWIRSPRSSCPATPRTATRQTVRDIVAAGHEIAHHGYLHEQPSAVDAAGGGRQSRPRPGRAGGGGRRPSDRLPRADVGSLVAHAGSVGRARLPLRLLADGRRRAVRAGGAAGPDSIVEIPIQWALDDWEQYCFLPDITGSGLIETPAKARELWQVGVRGAARRWGLLGADQPPVPVRTAGAGPRAGRADGRRGLLRRRLDRLLAEIATHVRCAGPAAALGRLPRRPAPP